MRSAIDKSRAIGGTTVLLCLSLVACSGASDPLGLPLVVGSASSTNVVAADAASQATEAGVDPDATVPSSTAATARADSSQPAGDAGTADEGGDAFAPDASVPAPVDARATGEGGAPRASCSVSFALADAFIDGVVNTTVAVGGNTAALGNWDPSAAVPMTSIGTGAWTLSLVMNDGDEIQFLFVKRGPSSYVWEDWGANSNRSLVVSCSPGSDAGYADGGPVVGTSYTGDFAVKPPDAT